MSFNLCSVSLSVFSMAYSAKAVAQMEKHYLFIFFPHSELRICRNLQ